LRLRCQFRDNARERPSIRWSKFGRQKKQRPAAILVTREQKGEKLAGEARRRLLRAEVEMPIVLDDFVAALADSARPKARTRSRLGDLRSS
jgi:hypothetical protein